MTDAAVGSISHILKTAFKEDFDERKKINEGREKKIQREIKLKEYEEKKRLLEEQRLEQERLAAEAALTNKKGKKNELNKNTGHSQDNIQHQQQLQLQQLNDELLDPTLLDEDIYENPVDKLPLSEQHKTILTEKLENIQKNLHTNSENAEKLVSYLTQQRDIARQKEIEEEENLKKQGIMVGQHIPSLVSQLDINPNVLNSFDNFSSNLLISRDLIEHNRERNLRRTGNLPISEEVEFKTKQRKQNKTNAILNGNNNNNNDNDNQPNYLQTTTLMKERTNVTKSKFVTFLSEYETMRTNKLQSNTTSNISNTNLGTTNNININKGNKAIIPKRDYGQSAIEKEQDQQILKTIQHKLNYLRNPRNTMKSVNRTLVTSNNNNNNNNNNPPLPPSITGSISSSISNLSPSPSPQNKLTPYPPSIPQPPKSSSSSSVQTSKRGSNLNTIAKTGNALFLTEPSMIIFNSYDIGNKYTASISFRNISSISRTLRVIPPSTSFFSLGQLQYPIHSKSGIVAPGMVILSEISFFPESLCDYNDFIQVETEGGSYTVPLIGKRNPPQLSLSSLIDIGSCLVGDALRINLPCTNNGGSGKFKLLKQEWYPVIPDYIDYSGCIRCSPFTIYPIEFELNKYETIHLTIEFIPIEIKIYQVNLVILFDNEQYITITLQGEGKEINCKVIEINSVSITDFNEHRLNKENKMMIKDLHFTNCSIGSEYEQEITISNTTGLSIEYEWIWIESKLKDIKRNSLNKLMIKDEQIEEKIEEKFQKLTQQHNEKKRKKKNNKRNNYSSSNNNTNNNNTNNNDFDDDLISSTGLSIDDEEVDDDFNDNHSCSSMGGYSITPGRGVFPSYGSSTFIVKFKPTSNEIESARMVLILRDITEASLPGINQDLCLSNLYKMKHGPYYRLQSWFDEIGTILTTIHSKHELDDLFLKGLKPHNIANKKINLEMLWNIVLNHSGYSINSYIIILLKYILGRLLSKSYRWLNRNTIEHEITDDDSVYGNGNDNNDNNGNNDNDNFNNDDFDNLNNNNSNGSINGNGINDQFDLNDDNQLNNNGINDDDINSTSSNSNILKLNVIYWDSSLSSNILADNLPEINSDDNFGTIFPTFTLNIEKEKLISYDFDYDEELLNEDIPFNMTHNISKYMDIDSIEGRKLRKCIWLSSNTIFDILGNILCEILDDKVKHEAIDFLQRINRINLPILDINSTGNGIKPTVHITPPLLTIGGSLGLGMEWKGEIIIHNTSNVMNEITIDSNLFRCENIKNKENMILKFSNSKIILHPNSNESIIISIIIKEIGDFIINIPVLPTSPFLVVNDIVLQVNVIGPKVRFETPELNLGLLNTGTESISILSFTNDTNIPLYYNLSYILDSLNNLNSNNSHPHSSSLAIQKRINSSPSKMSSSIISNRERDDDTHSIAHSARSQLTENSGDSYAIENATAVITFDPPAGSLKENESCQVKVKCLGGKLPQRIKGVIECNITDITRLSTNIPSQYLSLRGEIQTPLTILYPTLIDLGNVYVNTPIKFQVMLKNLTSLSSKYKFDRPGGDSAAYRLKYSEKNGELDGKETKIINIEYTALISGVTDDILACKIFGLSTPIGFQLKAISKGIQMEFIPLEDNQLPPEPLALPNEPKYPGPGNVPDPGPMKPLDFTSTVNLYERKIKRFAIRNLSAMPIIYDLKPRKYDVGEIINNDDESVTSSLAEAPILGQGMLVPKEDGENRFHSIEGKKYIGSLLKRRQDKHYLTLGLGASYSFEPKTGQIPPWGVTVVTVLSRNDMPGCFDDDIICDVKDHRKLYFPMKMSVLGCPLIIERDSYGMSAYNPSITDNNNNNNNNNNNVNNNDNNNNDNNNNNNSLLLQMGSATVNSEPIIRDFRVRNNGSSPATIKWKLRSVSSKVNGPIKFELKIGKYQNNGTKMGIKSNLLFWDDAAKDSPFEVEPKSTVIPAYSRKNFKIKFFRTSSIVNELALLTGAISFDSSSDISVGDRSQTASRATLYDDAQSGGSRSPTGNNNNNNNTNSNINQSNNNNNINQNNTLNGGMSLESTFSRQSKPTYNLSLYLKANIMLPEIKLDKNILSTTNQKITYVSNSMSINLKTDAPKLYSNSNNNGNNQKSLIKLSNIDPICKKVIVLTNPIPALLAFSVAVEGPFTIKYSIDEIKSTSSSSQLQSVSPSILNNVNVNNGSSVGGTCVLQSGASARFVLSFIPKKELRNAILQNTSMTGSSSSSSNSDKLTENEKGTLIISFSTGQQLYIPIAVTISTPFISLSSPRLYFGRCHVTKNCNGILLLSNPTDVIAKWSVSHIPGTGAGNIRKQSAIRVKGFDNNIQYIDDPTVFEITPMSGILQGPTVSSTAALYCPPNDVNRSSDPVIEQRPIETSWMTGKLNMKDVLDNRYETSYKHAIDSRYPLPIYIKYTPNKNVHYSSRYRFTCEYGNTFDVLLEAEGTYEEHEHNPLNPMPR